MESLLIDYRLDRPTWFYLSLLLTVALFFRFQRVWSLRNLDLLLLVSLSPGLLLVDAGSRLGYVWLFSSTAAILVRLLLDGLFKRRPRFPQNLNTAGLLFLLVTCLSFQLVELATADRLPASAMQTTRQAAWLVQRRDITDLSESWHRQEPPAGPAAAMLTAPAVGLSRAVTRHETLATHEQFAQVATRIAALVTHIALVVALLIMGWKLFGDLHLGVAMGTLYVLLPCTAYNVAQVNHLLPGALILWAVVAYRNPFISGGLLGLACGTLFFPVFLLPLWLTFYGRRNALRFGAALAAVWAVLLLSLAFTSASYDSFVRQVFGLVDWSMLRFAGLDSTGVWAGVASVYRVPVFVLFLVLVGVLSLWPRKKTLEPLLARSGAVVAGTQFWYPHEGGVYLLWFVPLLLAVMFRPVLTPLVPPPTARWPWLRRPKRTPAAPAVAVTAEVSGTPFR